MTRRVRLVVITEDTQSEMFLRRVLYGLGFQGRDLRFETAPKSLQAADGWVVQMHAAESRKLRAIVHAQPNTGMVTCIDADHHAVSDRHGQLNDAMERPRRPQECMAWIVPKRNIETWLRVLSGESADELTDYKRRGHEPMPCDEAARAFLIFSPDPGGAPGRQSPLPSIRTARAEIERVRP